MPSFELSWKEERAFGRMQREGILQGSGEEGRVPLPGKEGLALLVGQDVAFPIHYPRNQILVCMHGERECFVYAKHSACPRAERLSVTFPAPSMQ